jgi:RimJ/RimL family protein N-acetyltransferase
MTPTLTTERLTLRAWRRADIDAFAALYGSDRATRIGGPVDRRHAWRTMAMLAGEWALNGYGMWALETRDGAWAGHAGFFHPDHYEDPELGWVLTEAAEGQGLAQEAAVAARDWGRSNGIPRPASYIETGNSRSMRLAETLGARREATLDHGDGPFHIYRHPEATP